MKLKRLLFLLMVVMGVGGLVGGVYYAIERIGFFSNVVQTKAVIVDTFWESARYGYVEFPVFQFVDLNGVEHNVRGHAGGVFSASDIGKEADIYYDPENPTYVVSSNFLDMCGPSIPLLGFGFFFTLIGGFFFLKFDRIIGN